MAKRPKLADALHNLNNPAKPPAMTRDKPDELGRGKPQPSRAGMKQINGYFDPAVVRQLKQLALDQDTTVQNLLREALNDLFEKYHLKPFA